MFANQEDFWTSDDDETEEFEYDTNESDEDVIAQAEEISSQLCEIVLKDDVTDNSIDKSNINIEDNDDKIINDSAAERSRKQIRKKWSIEDNRDVTDFKDILGYNPCRKDMKENSEIDENKVLEYSFELDDFQKRAIINIHNGDHVLVAAHTSAGKTAIAEYAIELANKNGKKAIYTSPIKALSSQKYREFRERFKDYPANSCFTESNRIGIITGDVSINSDAQCVIMTTEILRTMLYRNDPRIEQIQTVIFDEVHYINDVERGVVWEEVLILLDPKVQLVLLSATIPNYVEFANWIGRIKQNTVYCIRTLTRPVPLKHYLYIYEKCFQIMDENNKFDINGYREMLDFIKNSKSKKNISNLKNKVNKLSFLINNNNVQNDNNNNTNISMEKSDDEGFGKETNLDSFDLDNIDNEKNKSISKPSLLNKQITNTNSESKFKTEVYRLQVFLKLLEKNDQLPVILFGFSRRKVEQLATSIPNLNFLYNHNEKSNIITFIKESTSKLSEMDQTIPQLLQCKELALRGIGIHHSGMLPIIKEMTEILFTKGLIKVLFATETISMGINCPARSIVFTSIKKYDGRKNRILLSSEYTQMSGRAGRRGIDTFGNVFIFNSSHETIPECIDIVKMMLNTYLPIQSKFRLTYQMILQLSCRHSLTIEDMMTKSFKEMFRAINLPIFHKNLNRKLKKHHVMQNQLQDIIKSLVFNYEDKSKTLLSNINQMINTIQNSFNISSKLYYKLLNSSINKNNAIQKIFNPGRILLFNTLNLINNLPLFANILEYNNNTGLFNIIVYSKEFISFNQMNMNDYINDIYNDNEDNNNKNKNDYYDVVEESIKLHQNTDKKKQINIVQNLINQDRKIKKNNQDLNNSNNKNNSNEIKLIHYSSFNKNLLINNNSSILFNSIDPNITINPFDDINHYYIFQNIPPSLFLFIFDNSIQQNDNIFRNINYNDKTILHNIAINCKNNINNLFRNNDNNNNNNVSSTHINKKSKNKKSMKINLHDFINQQNDRQFELVDPTNNKNINNTNPLNWPKILPLSKVLKSIEIEYFDLLKKQSDLYLEYINNEALKLTSLITENNIIPLLMELNKLDNDILIYKHFINDESLDDYPEMKLKIQLLIDKGFLDNNFTITTKGRIASEILTSDELTLVEILLNGMLHKLDIHEITAILSCFVFPEKMESFSTLNLSTSNSSSNSQILINDRPSLPTVELLNAHDELINIHKDYEKSHYDHQINIDSEHFWSLCNDKFMFIAYKWSNKESLKDIMEFINNSQINLHEGTIVRTILRLDELVRKIIIASKIMGDKILEEKLSLLHDNIARDIIFMTSLYFNN